MTGDGEDTVGTYYGFYEPYRYESTFYAPNTTETDSRSSVSESVSVVRQAEFTARTGLTGGNPTEASTLPNRRFIPAQGGALAADQTVGGYGQEGALIPVYYPSGQLKGHWYYPNASSAPTPQAGEAVVSVRREFIESDTSYVSSISRLGGGDDAVVGLNLDGGTGNDRLAINADRRYAQGDMALPVFLYGNDGNDHLFVAGEGANAEMEGETIMIGGQGRDRLEGRGGRNVFLLLEEDAIDTITDSGATGTDELVFGPGVTAASIRVLRADVDADSSSLQLLTAEGTGARIQIATGEHDAGKGIEVVSFSDGTQLTVAQLLARLDDSQEVLGSTWNDRLVLGAGDDVIDGVQGNDLLVGGRGNDVVRFGRGGGQDVIDQTGAGASDVDVLRFADDVQVSDVRVFRDEHDLYFEIADSGDLVVVKHWFDGGTRLSSVQFAGGVVVDASEFDTVPFRGGEVAGGVVAGSAGNDTLSAAGGSGNWARLEGAAGDDVLHAGWGAKTLSGGVGDDVFVFGRGDGAGSVFRNGPEPGEDDGSFARRDGGGGSRHGGH
ncbi:MAG: hypothetical protein IPG34_10825 [Rhodocyclaceae bacterium]|nr:hypothetical protein [Rhodocyclaceae bacterium]